MTTDVTTDATPQVTDPATGLPRDPATGQFVSPNPDPNAVPAAPVEPAPTEPAAPVVEPAKPEPTPDQMAAELAEVRGKLKFYQTGYQIGQKVASPDQRDQIKKELASRGYGPQAAPPAEGRPDVADPNDEFGVGKIVRQEISAIEKAKQLDNLVAQIQQESDDAERQFGDFCEKGGFAVDDIRSVVASSAVKRIDPLQPGGYQTRAYVASLILSNKSLLHDNERLVAMNEKLTAQVTGKVSGVSRPASAPVPTGAQMFPKAGQGWDTQLANDIAPDNPPVQ